MVNLEEPSDPDSTEWEYVVVASHGADVYPDPSETRKPRSANLPQGTHICCDQRGERDGNRWFRLPAYDFGWVREKLPSCRVLDEVIYEDPAQHFRSEIQQISLRLTEAMPLYFAPCVGPYTTGNAVSVGERVQVISMVSTRIPLDTDPSQEVDRWFYFVQGTGDNELLEGWLPGWHKSGLPVLEDPVSFTADRDLE